MRLVDDGEERQPYVSEADFEDEAWSDPGVLGIVLAIGIVVAIVALAAWLDGVRGLHGVANLIAGG